jgi:lysine 2,3-aminomutase
VSGLIQGDITSLMPEGNERMARRRKLQIVNDGDGGCSSGEAPDVSSRSPILSLPVLNGQHAANG